MGYEAKKTEHCGPKRGNGAYWGYRWDAKKESNRIRRENWKHEIRAALADQHCDCRQILAASRKTACSTLLCLRFEGSVAGDRNSN
ncbi:MAG: hypothetical protein IT170_14175 [Bryobacterales bacterium]|nr:hypothetical protein [Bryobacterales bacterium]